MVANQCGRTISVVEWKNMVREGPKIPFVSYLQYRALQRCSASESCQCQDPEGRSLGIAVALAAQPATRRVQKPEFQKHDFAQLHVSTCKHLFSNLQSIRQSSASAVSICFKSKECLRHFTTFGTPQQRLLTIPQYPKGANLWLEYCCSFSVCRNVYKP